MHLLLRLEKFRVYNDTSWFKLFSSGNLLWTTGLRMWLINEYKCSISMVFQPLKTALLDMKGFPFPQSNLTIQASSSLLPLIKKSFYSTTSIFIHFFVHHENHISGHYVLMMPSNVQILYHLSKLKWWNSITRTFFCLMIIVFVVGR